MNPFCTRLLAWLASGSLALALILGLFEFVLAFI